MFLAEIDQTQIAVLSGIGTTATAFSLVAGGPAVLSTPSAPFVDGQLLSIIVGGKIHSAVSNNNVTFGSAVGSSSTIGANQGANAVTANVGVGNFNFFLQSKFIWDSTSQMISGVGDFLGTGFSQFTNIFPAITGISVQTAIQFILFGQFSQSNAANFFTITEFKLELV